MATPYVGNNDFRGYLNSLAQNGDQIAGLLIGAGTGGTGLVGNNGVVNAGLLSNFVSSPADGSASPSAQTALGATEQDRINNINNYAKSAYSTFQGQQSGAGSSSGSAAQPAGVVSELQGQLNNLDPQQAIGLQNIANSFNTSANRLDQQNAEAQRDYGTQTQQNLQGYQNNRNAIIQTTNANASALQRLLGLNGAGNSSAAYEQAPYAAGLQGSQQLSGAQNTFGNNGINLDNAWQDTETNYGNSKDDLNNQRYQQENALRSSIAQTKASLLDQLASAQGTPGANAGDVNSLLNTITQLSQQYANPVVRTADLSYSTPSLSDYILKNTGTNAGAPNTSANGGAASDLSPSFLSLLTPQRDQYGNIINS